MEVRARIKENPDFVKDERGIAVLNTNKAAVSKHEIKMAALAQRAMNSEATDAGLGISDEEKQQLLDEINKFKSEE